MPKCDTFSYCRCCRASLDVALVCGVDLLNTCLSGPCPHILDVIPIQLRPVYAVSTSAANETDPLQSPSNVLVKLFLPF